MYISINIHYSIRRYVVMHRNTHVYKYTHGHMEIPIYVGLFYSFIPSFLSLVLLYPNGDIGPLNQLSEPCSLYVDILPYPLFSLLYAMDGGLKGNLLYPLPVGFIHSLYANNLAWFLLGLMVITLYPGKLLLLLIESEIVKSVPGWTGYASTYIRPPA